MDKLFSSPSPKLKNRPLVYPEWEEPNKKSKNPGFYQMTALDLKLSLDDSIKTKNFIEYSTNLQIRLIKNDGTKQALIWLTMVRNVFRNQLRNMPESYITRLVFNPKHYTVILLLDGDVLGGICFRPFLKEDFAEIAFCAVSMSQQVRGYGTFIMACVKTYLQHMGIYNILTYADNSAISYFKRQGFTLEIFLKRELWQRRIKDYKGATLVHCKIREDVDYMQINKILDEQKRYISNRLPEYPIEKPTHWPITSIRGIRINKEPEFDYRNQMHIVLAQAKSHSKAWPFLNPVSKEDAPEYDKIIKKPMDFSTLEKNLNEGKYQSLKDFRDDLFLIFENCYKYNEADSVYVKSAQELEKYSKQLLREHSMGHTRRNSNY